MQESMSWYAQLSPMLDFSPASIESFGAGLEADFAARAGFPFPRTAVLLPPIPDPFRVQKRGPIHFVEGDLVWQGEGFLVRIAWTLAEDGTWEKAWWDGLPLADIHAGMQAVENPFREDRFQFAIDYQVTQLPHVLILFQSEPNLKAQLDARLKTVTERYNARAEGLIHNLGLVEEVSAGQYLLPADLGTGLYHGLGFILEELVKVVPRLDRVVITNGR